VILYDAARCPYCARARIVLAEKGLGYETVEIDLSDRPGWIYAKNPSGTVPVLEEDGGFVLPESLVIMEYLEERFPEPPLWPADPEERAYVEPRLAQLLGLAEHSSPDKQDLFAAWRLFFERLAAVYPTVLAFEDMQWADASLLDFVEHLLDWSRHHSLYVITLARPELVERRPTWGAGQRNFTSIYLDPLSEEAMGDLLDGLAPGLDLRDALTVSRSLDEHGSSRWVGDWRKIFDHPAALAASRTLGYDPAAVDAEALGRRYPS